MKKSSALAVNCKRGGAFFALFCLFGALTMARGDVRDALLSYWPLDANNAGTTPDAVSGNTLNIVGNPTVGGGQFGNAFTLNGAYMTNLHTADNTVTGLPIYRAGNYSITLWVKGAAQTAKYLFTEGNTNTTTPIFILQTGNATASNNKFDVIIRNDGNVTLANHVFSTNVVFDNNWHHIAWVDNRGSAKLYVDGVLDAANFNYTPSGTFTLNTTAIGTLVRTTVSTGNIFAGQMDDVALWERDLTQAEVQQIMASSVPTPIATLPSIVVQPVSGTRGPGDRITFTSRAAGNRPFTYQWLKGGAEVSGATSNSLRVRNITEADAGDYALVVSNLSGSVTSTVATLTFVADPTPELPQGLVSYWPMDTLVPDVNQIITQDPYSHNHLTLVNMDDVNQIPGMFGNALGFNGVDEYGFRRAGFPIYNNPGYSVALWVNANGTGQTDRHFFTESSTNNNNPLFTFGTHTNGVSQTIRVYIRNDSAALLMDRNSTAIALDGAWHHIVWTETNGQAKLYIDGVLDETDFTYTRGTLSLDQTAVGAIVRAAVSSYFAGSLDDVAVWNRVLSYTEIQQIRTTGIPVPIMEIPPTITQQPTSQAVLTGSRATFSFVATGTSPLAPQWRKNGMDLSGETNVSLMLSNIMLSDAGDFTVVVTNSAGRATSEVATLTVTLRPPPPTELKIDFNNTLNESPADTEPGFSSFALPGIGSGPVTHSYSGADITLTGVGGNMESRKRLTPVNGGNFTQERLLQDFIFARDSTPATGMDIAVEFLDTNRSYAVTLWSFDSGSTGLRYSDWLANGTEVQTAWAFDGNSLPTSNEQYRFNFNANSDATGKILIQGRRTSGATGVINVFINALQLTRREVRITSVELIDGTAIHMLIEMINPSALVHIEQKASLSDPTWEQIPDGDIFFIGPNGNILDATFAADPAPRFYRVVEAD